MNIYEAPFIWLPSLFLLWLLVLLLGAVINHFRRKKLDLSLVWLICLFVPCVLELLKIFDTDNVLPQDRPHWLGQWFVVYAVLMLPAWLVSRHLRKKHAREAAMDPIVYQVQGYKDLEALNKWVIAFLYVLVAVAVLSSLADFQTVFLLAAAEGGSHLGQERLASMADSNESVQRMVAVLFRLDFLILGGLMLRWVYRVSFNAWQFAAGNSLRYTPWAAVGSFFIPVLNLWRPYRVMREVWQVSHELGAPQAVRRRWLVRCWWALFLTVVLLMSLVFFLSLPYQSQQTPVMSTVVLLMMFSIVINLLLVVLALVTVMLVKRLHATQRLGANVVLSEPSPDAEAVHG